jgi:hypothetical protein
MDNIRSRSETEVERILPSNEQVPDPREFYASDSPVLEYNADTDSDVELYESAEEFLEVEDLEVRDNRQVGSRFSGPRVCLSHLAHTSHC